MDFEDLYQDIVLDHCRRPRNFGALPTANAIAEGDNPTCGDEVTVYLERKDGEIEKARFTGSGCSICMASASLMTLKLQHCPESRALELFEAFHDMLTSDTESEPSEALGDLRILQTVRRYPQRVKCATLPWQTLKKAVQAPLEPQAAK